MGIPTEAAPLPTGGLPVERSKPSEQTFKGEIADNIYAGTVIGQKLVTGNFQGKETKQIVFYIRPDGYPEDSGHLALYRGAKLSDHERATLKPFLKMIGRCP